MSTSDTNNRFRALVIVITIIMMLTGITVSNAGYETVYAIGETAQVEASMLNVRSGAGTKYPIIGSLNKGKTFIIKGSATDNAGLKWYKLKYGQKIGYVSSEYINIKLPYVTKVSNLQGTVKISGKLKVRSGPGTSHSKVGTIANGKTFDITGKTTVNGRVWYRFTYNGKKAYVSSKYVETSEKSSISYKVTAVSNLKGTVKGTSKLIVRSGAGTNYSRLGTILKGKTFDITGKTTVNGRIWYRFTYNDKEAYVSSKYVKTSKVSATSSYSVKKISNLKGTVKSSNGLNVRSGPGTNYSKLGILLDGESFNITGKTTVDGVLWYRFTYNGKAGFVSSQFIKTSSLSSTQGSQNTSSKPVTIKVGTVTANGGLNVRSGAGTEFSVLTVLDKGDSMEVTGSKKASDGVLWYTYEYSSTKKGYVSSDYINIKKITSDSEFESYLSSEGFPESYKTNLRILHASHPKWKFKAVKVGYSWSDALSKEGIIGRNLVHPSSPVSYRSKAAGAYNSQTGVWARFDGSWYAAHSKVIAYYMDPRNFLTENGIYQFMTHRYDSGSQNASTVKAVINGSFMDGTNPGGGYANYQALINAAGKSTNVNPNVLAAMIIQEQGWSGSSLVSGTYSGYKGYYNFFNIGAYTTSSMNAVQRGLWYAKNQGWNTRYKSIKGGAEFYSKEYVSANQDSYYTKKFNVKNGLSRVGTHQYMTNVAGAAGEGALVKRAYNSNSNYPVVFEIPVYNNMPSSVCSLP